MTNMMILTMYIIKVVALERNGFTCINFSDKLKSADISPTLKAVESNAKNNYRPVSIFYSICKLL